MKPEQSLKQLQQQINTLYGLHNQEMNRIQEIEWDITALLFHLGLQRTKDLPRVRLDKAPKLPNYNNWRKRLRQWLRGEI